MAPDRFDTSALQPSWPRRPCAGSQTGTRCSPDECGDEPESFAPDEIFAVRMEGRVILSRVAWSDGRLVLLPPGGQGEFRSLWIGYSWVGW